MFRQTIYGLHDFYKYFRLDSILKIIILVHLVPFLVILQTGGKLLTSDISYGLIIDSPV